MNISEAKEILRIYRPDTRDAEDAHIQAALQLARENPELGDWLREQELFHGAMRRKFSELPVPPGLKDRILAGPKVIRPQFRWSNATWLQAAAVIVLLAALAFGLLGNRDITRTRDRFADYESRMVRSALREYRMDVVTNDLKQVRSWMASRGAPADFTVPGKLSNLQLTGGGVLHWRNHPVSMVCFNRGDNQMLFLFVMDRAAVKDAPASAPQYSVVSRLAAAGWTEGDKTYLLAGPKEANFIGKYF